ncbi:AAA family ATPase [Sessilibacter corallicola]|uniref:AAA family ATPase n=1 Tax=Sessilibacter corallicola TaxID=2904075 RepID=A0ABQ0A9H5_9GAMM
MAKIKSIDIENFGSYRGFSWNKSVIRKGEPQEFKRLNILYGRNYSGKTTLSRIISCIETKKYPDNYNNPSFSITTESGVISTNNVFSVNENVRVYNKDFIKRNLSFLEDHHNGQIETFAIIGSDNQKLEEQIKVQERNLGNIEERSGLLYERQIKLNNMNKARELEESHNSDIEKKLKNHANNKIKKNRTYGHANYNITKIRADIDKIRKNSIDILSDEEVSNLKSLTKEETLNEIIINSPYQPQSLHFHKKVEDIVSKKINPTAPIQDLLNDSILQAWVKSGITHHKGKRNTCGFCNQELPADIWQKLDKHFNKESDDLDRNITEVSNSLKSEISNLSNILGLTKDQFYSSEKSNFETYYKTYDKSLNLYKKQLDNLLNVLEKRKNDIFSSIQISPLENDGRDLTLIIKKMYELARKNNNKTKTLAQDKAEAIEKLRINDVAVFIQNIDLAKEEQKSSELKKKSESETKDLNEIDNKIEEIKKRIEELRIQQNDERKGAEKVNEYLNHFFGHKGLSLKADEDSKESTFIFKIMRGDNEAYNLSEGECSLISFCYFIAKLEDTKTKGKDLIIYIDDPISSLDSNHIFFVYSLIESVIAKPLKNSDGSNNYKYEQLFISTHNLDFFKYLKRLSHPKRKNSNNGGKSKAISDSQYFIIESGEHSSKISLMPNYLKDYTTEFNYLFHQIFLCRDSINANENHERFYSFGNNLRKFLEAFLFYKYPYQYDKNNSLERLIKFFGEDPTSTTLTNRISNELSHLEEIFDRSMKPIEIPEIPKLANFVLDKIYEKDPDQYNALLKSIGEPERVP